MGRQIFEGLLSHVSFAPQPFFSGRSSPRTFFDFFFLGSLSFSAGAALLKSGLSPPFLFGFFRKFLPFPRCCVRDYFSAPTPKGIWYSIL